MNVGVQPWKVLDSYMDESKKVKISDYHHFLLRVVVSIVVQRFTLSGWNLSHVHLAIEYSFLPINVSYILWNYRLWSSWGISHASTTRELCSNTWSRSAICFTWRWLIWQNIPFEVYVVTSMDVYVLIPP